MRLFPWLLGSIVTLSLGSYLTWSLLRPTPDLFLPGPTTDGHHQIEDACQSCHTPLGGVEQEACLRCHGQELIEAHDSHPPSKFTDPRNAERVAQLDAARCITCHVEHRPDMTRPMAVTLPDDFCWKCHATVAEERPSHRGMAFSTCAEGGCHNFHDNRALYEDFLLREAQGPDTRADGRVLARVFAPPSAAQGAPAGDAALEAPANLRDPAVERAFLASQHAAAGLGCKSCHDPEQRAADLSAGWLPRPPRAVCADCHPGPDTGFVAGKHGMRLSVELSPMRPGWARLPMLATAKDRELGCSSCHDAHRVDTVLAAVSACEGCHADGHTQAYRTSEHFRLWQAGTTQPDRVGPQGASCATCHLPRRELEAKVQVEHNQNANLRPNEKMVREVCLACHGLQFSLDALADAELVARNFDRPPKRQVTSIRMALSRRKRPGNEEQQPRRN